jgi:hypothetical protein
MRDHLVFKPDAFDSCDDDACMLALMRASSGQACKNTAKRRLFSHLRSELEPCSYRHSAGNVFFSKWQGTVVRAASCIDTLVIRAFDALVARACRHRSISCHEDEKVSKLAHYWRSSDHVRIMVCSHKFSPSADTACCGIKAPGDGPEGTSAAPDQGFTS